MVKRELQSRSEVCFQCLVCPPVSLIRAILPGHARKLDNPQGCAWKLVC